MFNHWGVFSLLLLPALIFCPCHSQSCGDPSEIFTEDPESQSTMMGSKVSFTCAYNGGSRTWVWQFYPVTGNELTIRDNFSFPQDFIITRTGELIIPFVRLNHSGKYQCRVAPPPFPGCNIFSRNASLYVTSPPTMHLQRTTFSHDTTQNVVIVGEVTGWPVPIVDFYKKNSEDVELDESRMNIIQPQEVNSTFVITILNLQASDGGKYGVKATNEEGSSPEKEVSLTVRGPDPPMISLSVNTQYLIQPYGTTIINVLCSIQESAIDNQASLTWIGPGGIKNQSTKEVSVMLNLQSFQQEEEGEYICTAHNSRTTVHSSALYVYAPISLSQNPIVVDLGDDEYKVTWTPPSPPYGVPIYQYVVYIYRNGHEYQKIRINGSLTEYPISAAILPEGEYSVEVAVVLGNHDTTATGEGNAMRALSNIHVSIAGSSDSQTDSTAAATIGVVAAVVVLIIMVTVIVIVVLLLRNHRRQNYNGPKKGQMSAVDITTECNEDYELTKTSEEPIYNVIDVDVIHTSGNEAYLAVKQTEGTGADPADYETPLSVQHSSQPPAEDSLYEPV